MFLASTTYLSRTTLAAAVWPSVLAPRGFFVIALPDGATSHHGPPKGLVALAAGHARLDVETNV